MLPHLTLSEAEFNQSQSLLIRTLYDTIGRQREGLPHVTSPWSSAPDGASETVFTMPNCELIVYLQQLPPLVSESVDTKAQSRLLGFLEDELRVPTGASLLPARDMRFSLLAFSPDCGYALESKGPPDFAPQEGDHLVGPKMEVEYSRGRRHVLIFAAVLACQLSLLTKQMREASTPSTRSRISFYTVALLALGDGFTTMTLALISLFLPLLWVLVMATSFLAFLSVSFFGMRFLMDIWTVQAPERERRERERRTAASHQVNPPADTTPASVPMAADSGTLPLPATSRRADTGATPIIIPSDQGEVTDGAGGPTAPGTAPTANSQSSSFGALYTRFYLLLLGTLFLSLNATSWPAGVRRAFFTTLSLFYLSFWTPQIARNAVRNCRRALRWDYVLGQSVLRIVPFAYFYGYSSNILFAPVDLISLSVLGGWLWIQCLVLVSQELVGPRWFVGSTWVPPAYDYHPLLREDEEGGNLPIGFSQAANSAPASPVLEVKIGESRDRGKRVFDCAICMQELEVAVAGPDTAVEGGLGAAGSLLARRAYMVTPCRHIFHANCLEGWMKYRLQCPICREDLPPL